MQVSIKNNLYMVLVSALSALTLSPVASAYDTDIYFSNVAGSGGSGSNHGSQPNILFVLDTSGSMGWNMTKGDSSTPVRMTELKKAMNAIIDASQNVNMGIMRFGRRGGAVVYPVADINADAGLVELQLEDDSTEIIKGPFTTTNRVRASSGDAKELIDTSRAVDISGALLPAFSELKSGVSSVAKSLEVRIVDGDDDGEEKVGINRYGPTVSISNTQLTTMVGTDKSEDDTDLRLLGFRFRDLDIAQGATITSAQLRLRATQRWKGDVAWEVSIDQDPQSNPFRPDAWLGLTGKTGISPFSGFRNDSRDQGVVVPWTEGTVNSNRWTTSDNINNLLQRVVSDPGWIKGSNAVSLFLWPDPDEAPDRLRKKQFRSGDDGTEWRRPRLRVNYIEDQNVVVTTENKLGFHFSDLRVPQGAKILSAKLVLASAQSGNSPVNMRIYAQNSGDANAFQNLPGDISNRLKLGGVQWNIDSSEGWVVGDFYESPDITSLVQTVVDRSDWCGGNGAALILEGTGDREIATFDADPDLAPRLVVEYENEFDGSDTGCTVDETAYQINTGTSDADESSGSGSVATGDVLARVGGSHWAGFNFSGIRVPSGANIEGATLTLNSAAAGAASVNIMAHDTDSSDTFSSTADNISTRPRTSASRAWVLNAPGADVALTSPDFSNVASEIIQRPGWLSGGNISLVLRPSGGAALPVHTYEKAVFDSARLNLRYQYDLVVNVAGASGITVRQRLKEIVNDLPASGGTPATDALHEATKYLMGDTVRWGSERWGSSTGRLSIPASYSPLDASINNPSGCPGGDSNDYDCRYQKINENPLPKYVSPIVNTCQNTYVVLLSDGDPNTLYGTGDIGTLTGSSCSGDDACAVSLANFMKNKDLLPDGSAAGLPGPQNATVKTIRFADDADPTYLKKIAAAANGGTHTDTEVEGFYEADSAEKLIEAFNNIVGEAVSKPQTFAAPSVALSAYNRLQTGSNLYYSMFLPLVSKRWGGNIKHYKLSAAVGDIVGQNNVPAFVGGNVSKDSQSFWSNPGTTDGDKVDSGGFGERLTEVGHANRSVYTYTGSSAPSNAVIKNNDNLFERNNSRVLALSQWPGGLSSADKNNLIDWARGKDLDDSDGDESFVDTRWVMGDPLHGQPTSITYDGGSDVDSSADDTVKIFIGTNAGFIHALDAATGEELWSFIPPEMLAIQDELRKNVDGPHVFGVDGRITAWVNDTNNDGDITSAAGDSVILYVPFGRGARSLYAIDVTNANNPKIVWKIDSSTTGYANLGQTWSKPVTGKIKVDGVEKQVLVMGGGYDTAYDSPSYSGAASIGRGVYIVDALTGERILWISSDSSADLTIAGMNSAIPSDISAVDIIGPDRLIDRLYFGDLLGRMWRVDLTNIGRKDAGQSIGYLMADLNGSGAEAGRRFFNPPVVVPFADEGNIPEYLYILLTSGDINNPLAKQTLNSAFAVKDGFALLETSTPSVLTLVEGESNAANGILNVTRYTNTERPADLPKGYYFNFVNNADENVGRLGLQSGFVVKEVDDEEIDYVWGFPVYDPSRNNSAPDQACSSSVVGETVTYGVYLKDGFPVENKDDAANSAEPDDRILNLPAVQGIAPTPTEVSTDDPTDPQCATVSGFTVLTSVGEKLCSGANTTNTYWWRSR